MEYEDVFFGVPGDLEMQISSQLGDRTLSDVGHIYEVFHIKLIRTSMI